MRGGRDGEKDSLAGAGFAIALAVAVAVGVAIYVGYLIVTGQTPAVVPHS